MALRDAPAEDAPPRRPTKPKQRQRTNWFFDILTENTPENALRVSGSTECTLWIPRKKEKRKKEAKKE